MVVTSEPEVTDLLTEREDGNNPGTVQGQAEESVAIEVDYQK